jgi:hypothetical protein
VWVLGHGWSVYYSEVRYLEWGGMNIFNISILVPGAIDTQFAVDGDGFEDETDGKEGITKRGLLCD